MEDSELEVVYIEGNAAAFKAFTDEHFANGTIEMTNIDGKARWKITRPDGTQFIARPSHREHEWFITEEEEQMPSAENPLFIERKKTGKMLKLCKTCPEKIYL